MQLRIESWTPSAREWVAHTTEARVLHVFQDVCNLISPQGQILSLIAAGVDRTAFCVRLRPSAEFDISGGFGGQLDANAPVKVAPYSIRVGRLEITIGTPESWDPVPNWNALRRLGRLDADLRAVLAASLMHEAPPGGLAGLSVEYEPEVGLEKFEDATLDAARPAAVRLEAGFRNQRLADIMQAAAFLSGLGAGLTPSGDDYLVGCMHALWSALREGEAGRLGRSLVQAAVGRTTELSMAWLAAASRGEAAEHWHVVLEALAAGDLTGLKSAASRLVRVGHSSGADSLAGFLAARAALEQGPLSSE